MNDNFLIPETITSGDWLNFGQYPNNRFNASIISVVIWYVWKVICEKKF